MLRVAVAAALLASSNASASPRGWSVQRDDVTIPVAEAAAEQGARALLPAGQFALLANHLDHRGIRTVTFAQHAYGLPVLGAAIGFVIRDDRLVATYSSAWPDVRVVMPGGGDLAKQLRAISTELDATAHATFSRVIVADEVGGVPRYRVADSFEARARHGIGHWDVYVTADGEIAAKRTRVMTGTGTLEYNAGVRWAGGARTDYPASRATILVNGISTTTSATGTFSWTGTSPSSVVTSVTGPYVRVINIGGASAMLTLSVAPGATGMWNASASELDDAQVSAFVFTNIANARARIINPAVTTWLDDQLDVNVNEAGSCNATFSGNALHFYRRNAMCENTALVGDVVFHEFGHGLHINSVIPGMGSHDEHVSEGLADFFACHLTGDPGMGRGFFKNDEPLRHIDPPGYERVFPSDMDVDTHISGLIIAGALWDLRKTVGVTQIEQIFTGVMQRSDVMESTYTAALIADDDDANLTNGTPNFCAIEAAFGRHGLVPGYVGTSVGLPVVSGRQIAMHVSTPTGTACPPLAVTSIKVTWSANDGVASELQLVASGDDWTAEFPEQPNGTLITYTVDVQFADGSLQSFPNNPADPRYQLFLGEGTVLWCEPFDADPGWEETSNLGREWQWAAPVADPEEPDPDAPYSGAAVFGTDITTGGDYRPTLRTAIATPAITIPTFETVRLQYRRWLTVEDATFDQATIEANDTEIWRNASEVNGTLDHVDREWRFHDLDVTPYVIDGGLQLRWILDADGSKELGGWTIDDVCVIGLAKIPYCGDGEVDVGEQCDDGNREAKDGCDAKCIDEVESGGGGCCSSSGDRGSWWLALVVLALLQRRRRASSLVPSGSVSARMPK